MAIDEALKCKATGEAKCILIGYSGHGFFDLAAYERYLGGKLEDHEYSREQVEASLKELPVVPDPV